SILQAGNPVKEILLKLNLPDHRLILTDSKIHIKKMEMEVWSLEATGEFSVKYVRHLIDDLILPKEEVTTRWVKVMPIKINVFAWRVCVTPQMRPGRNTCLRA
ncbi:hypothetical protein Tco_0984678, partial [Tanacetum coccineum]